MNSEPRSVEDDLTTLKIDVAVMRSNYATKSDLQDLRLEQRSDLQELRVEHKSDYHELKLQIERLRVELHNALRAQIWKLGGLLAAIYAAGHVATRFGY